MARATAAQFQCYVFDINGLGAGGVGRSCIVDPTGNFVYQAAGQEETMPYEVDLAQVRRTRETGLRGLGQTLKSFRDREAHFDVYDRASGRDAYLIRSVRSGRRRGAIPPGSTRPARRARWRRTPRRKWRMWPPCPPPRRSWRRFRSNQDRRLFPELALESRRRESEAAAGGVDEVDMLALREIEDETGHQRLPVDMDSVDQPALRPFMGQQIADPGDLRFRTVEHHSQGSVVFLKSVWVLSCST